MGRTFVCVELVGSEPAREQAFSAAMAELGFTHSVLGRKTHKPLRLPTGMYLIENKTPEQALAQAREAAGSVNVEARTFCVPVGGDVRFGNLSSDDDVVADPSA